MVPCKEHMDSTNQKLFPPDARASRDIFQARLQAAFLSSLRHNLSSKVRLRNNQTPRNVYMWMQQ